MESIYLYQFIQIIYTTIVYKTSIKNHQMELTLAIDEVKQTKNESSQNNISDFASSIE